MTQIVFTGTGSGSWGNPGNYQASGSTWEGLGAGGAGGKGANANYSGGGGGGGGRGYINNVSTGFPVSYHISPANAGNGDYSCWGTGNSNASGSFVWGQSGGNGSGTSHGSGGGAAPSGYGGGDGGQGLSGVAYANSGGGGGAAGPSGGGYNGGNGTNSSSNPPSGGAANAGTVAGGGPGSNGNNGNTWSGYGPGSGAGSAYTASHPGNNGGYYGGGGSGGYTGNGAANGSGTQGLVIVSYTPLPPAATGYLSVQESATDTLVFGGTVTSTFDALGQILAELVVIDDAGVDLHHLSGDEVIGGEIDVAAPRADRESVDTPVASAVREHPISRRAGGIDCGARRTIQRKSLRPFRERNRDIHHPRAGRRRSKIQLRRTAVVEVVVDRLHAAILGSAVIVNRHGRPRFWTRS